MSKTKHPTALIVPVSFRQKSTKRKGEWESGDGEDEALDIRLDGSRRCMRRTGGWATAFASSARHVSFRSFLARASMPETYIRLYKVHVLSSPYGVREYVAYPVLFISGVVQSGQCRRRHGESMGNSTGPGRGQ